MSSHHVVTCTSGFKGTRVRLHDQYSDLATFQRYDKVYGIIGRFGYSDPLTAWDENPWLEFSDLPLDARCVPKRELFAPWNRWLEPRLYDILVDPLQLARPEDLKKGEQRQPGDVLFYCTVESEHGCQSLVHGRHQWLKSENIWIRKSFKP